MHRSYLIILSILLIHHASFCQSVVPNSYVNVGVGLGPNYGTIGTKSVIGYRNSGLLLGLGMMPGGTLGFEVGAQLSIKWFYLNVGYGRFGTYQVNDGPERAIESTILMAGGMINVGPAKRTFIDIGIGRTFGAPQIYVGPFKEDLNTFTGVIGIGRRLFVKEA